LIHNYNHAPNNGTHPTTDTTTFIFGKGAGRRVMPAFGGFLTPNKVIAL